MSELSQDDPKTGSTVLVGVVGITLIAVSILLLEVLYRHTEESERHRKIIAEQPLKLRQVQVEQVEALNGYRWVDRANGVVAIPIDRAMDLQIADSRPSGAGGGD